MNQLGLTLVWCVIQVTIVSAVSGLVYLFVRRRGPAVGSVVVVSSLGVILALTLLAFSPWPNWTSFLTSETGWTVHRDERATGGNPSRPRNSVSPEIAVDDSTGFGPYLSAFWSELGSHHVQVRTPHGLRWPAIVAALFAFGVVAGALRLLAGILAVRSYR